jgi:hypothetical protein
LIFRKVNKQWVSYKEEDETRRMGISVK